MKSSLIRFFANEDGAVTVDWVVLVAAVVGLAVIAAYPVSKSALALNGQTSDTLGKLVTTPD